MSRSATFLAARMSALSRPEDRSLREALILESLADRSASVREVAVAWAARCLEPAGLVPLVAEAADDVLRNAALAALERQGPYAVDCVESMVTDADHDLAMFACQVLGGIGGPRSSAALLTALSRPEVNVVQAAAEALGRLRARDAGPALVALLQREPWLQLAAADALGTIGDPAAVGPLLALVPDSLVAEPALAALAKLGSAEALPALVPLLLDPNHARLRDALLDAVAGSLSAAEPSEACRVIGRSIEADHAAGGLWQYLAAGLTSAHDAGDAPGGGPRPDDRGHARGGHQSVRVAGTVALATEIASLIPLAVRWAATTLGAEWVRPLVLRYQLSVKGTWWQLLSHPDPDVRAGAIRVSPPSQVGVERLLAALHDSESVVRIAAAEALGALGDGKAAAALEPLLDAEVPAERTVVVQALASLPPAALEPVLAPRLAPETPDIHQLPALAVLAAVHVENLAPRVLELAASAPGPVRRLALRAAAQVPGSRAEVLLLRALADRDQSLQVEALELLVARGGNRVMTTLLALLGVADSLRYHVIRALGRLRATRAAGPLEALFTSAPLHEQLEILDALPRIGAAESRPFLFDCLRHRQVEIRHAAAHALADLAEPGDSELLSALAQDDDWVLRSEAARALGRLGLSEGRSTLLDLVRDLEPAVARTARAALAGRP